MMLQAEPVQTATASFFVPVVAAWAAAFAGHAWLRRRWAPLRPAAEAPPSARPWLDVALVVAVTVGILGLGQLWHGGYLRWDWPGAWSHAAFATAQLVVWSPLFLALAVRRQGGKTVWVTGDGLLAKLGAGLVLGALAVSVFLALRGELGRWPALLEKAATPRSLAHAAPVFLEGVGIAFLYVRLRWALGPALAAFVPGALFALAHVPNSLAAGESTLSIAAFFAFNTVFVACVLVLLARTRDVVWVGVAHFLTDLAIEAF